jgi:glycosyltransferase involved in cell wall biosynthesis
VKVVHVSPTFFEPGSVIGGGERYPLDLARAMAEKTKTELISFSDQPRVEQHDSLTVRLYKPWFYVKHEKISPIHFPFLKALNSADIVHCYQYHTWITSISALWAKLRAKKIFVTDLGGGGWDLLSYHGGTWHFVTGFCHISDFASRSFLKYPRKHSVIYGGVDTAKFYPLNKPRERKVLFVGRLLPHKGIDVLIRAIDDQTRLTIIGRPYSTRYFDQLKELAQRKQVEFKTNSHDTELLEEYNTASVLVLSSVDTTSEGIAVGAPELLGLVVLEAMACKTPVIVTTAGSLPELVEHGKTGFIVPAGNVTALARAIHQMLNEPQLANQFAESAYEIVQKRFRWDSVTEKLLKEYERPI